VDATKQHLSRLISLLAVLFIVDIISVFQNYWWKDTFRSVYWTLAIIAFLNLLFPKRHLMLRIPLDLCIAVVTTFCVTWHRQPETVERFIERLPSLHPFLEITMAVVLVLILVERFTTSKSRLMLVFAIGLLTITIRDSFSPLKLWINVVVLVVIFLLWHTLIHYRSLDSKTMTNLLKRPLSLFVPFTAVLAIITMIGISLPHGPPLLEDPYALWKKSRGESVPAFLGDTGYGASSPSSLVTTSGYSRDSSELGGGFNYDYSTVLTVTTNQKGYLKGETKAYYNGKGWIDGSLGSPEPVRLMDAISSTEAPLAKYADIEQQVTVHRNEWLPAIFSNGLPRMISELQYTYSESENEEYVFEMDPSSTLIGYSWNETTASLLAPTEQTSLPITHYTLQSSALIIDQDGLKQSRAAFGSNNVNDQAETRAYVTIPETVPERVHELARTVTETGTNDYERALLLEQYLKMNYSYTNSPDLSRIIGSSDDFVDQFLFELQEGYCDYFSTSMVIMARALDMPARWVIGYTAGVNVVEEMYMNNPFMESQMGNSLDTSGTYTVRNADAHSWVEIYFEGYGWVPFEPTPGFTLPQQYEAKSAEDLLNELLTPENSTEVEEQVSAGGWNLTDTQRSIIWWSCAALLIVIIAAIVIRYRLTLQIRWRKLRYYAYSDKQLIIFEVNQLLRKGKRLGLPSSDTSTMRETLQAWKEYYPSLQQELEQLLTYFEAANYSKHEMTTQDVEKVRAIIERVKLSWKNKK